MIAGRVLRRTVVTGILLCLVTWIAVSRGGEPDASSAEPIHTHAQTIVADGALPAVTPDRPRLLVQARRAEGPRTLSSVAPMPAGARPSLFIGWEDGRAVSAISIGSLATELSARGPPPLSG